MYLYYRTFNLEKENQEFEQIIKDINDDLEIYKNKGKKRKYLTRFN